jgi:glycosyltransferase involved in cell wall biosynthesis
LIADIYLKKGKPDSMSAKEKDGSIGIIDHISVVIITKNAELHLAKCLDALKRFAEVILLDSGSSDNTISIASAYPNIKIHHQPFTGFGKQKNKAASLAKNDWIFSLDADEVPDEKCIDGMATYRPNKDIVGLIKRYNYYNHKLIEACGWQNDIIPRFYNRTHTSFAEKIVHEVIDTSHSTVIRLSGALHHYAYDNPDGLLQKMQFYSTLYAQENRFKKKTSPVAFTFKTFIAFIKNYFLLRGIFYGYEGFLISYSNAAGVFYKYAKLYEMNRHIKVSLLITTYNRPDALALVLKSVFNQSVLPHQIVVADDGSDERTKSVVDSLRNISPVTLTHIWHEDTGFRLAEIRNKAIAASDGEYIIMIDGDMVLQKNFIKSHINAATPGLFIQGSRVLLSEPLTNEKLKSGSISFNAFMAGITNRLNAMNIPFLSRIVSRVSDSFGGVRGANMSFWREDLIKVNGFDNNFVGWGREDSEFCARMLRAGIRRKNLKLGGVAYHLYHPESPKGKLSVNDHLLEESIKENRLKSISGVDKFL